jgi:sugar phosphate isomerase/epimerase
MTKLGFQLYSARNFPPLSDVLKKLSAAGYAHVEGFGGIYGSLDDAGLKALRADLDANNLTMPTGHFGIDMLESEPEKALNIASTLGIKAIYCPHLMPDQRPSDAAGWLAFGKRLQEAAKPFRDAGLAFGWHNHDFEFVKLEDGSTPQEQIFAGGPELEWEADIASPGENTDEDGWADVGHGTVDWKGLVDVLKKTAVKYYVVEHDNPKDVDRLITRSITSFNAY